MLEMKQRYCTILFKGNEDYPYVIQGPCRQPKARSTCAPSGPKQLSTSNKYQSQCTSIEPRATFLANVANSGHNGAAISHIGSRSHRRKIKRSRRTAKKSLQAIKPSTCNFLYANTNGFKSKAESINLIILEESIDVILLTETKVYTRSAINIKGFQGFSVVRDKKVGGGIFLGIRQGLYETVMIDSGDKAQSVTVQLTNKDFNVQIVLVYGPQENDPEDIRESFHHDVSVQIQTADINGDFVILVDDFNAKLGHSVVQNDIHPMSKNGELLFDMFNNYNIKLLNSSKFCNGTFTRTHKYRQEIEKSVLEYVFVSFDLENILFQCTLMNQKILLLGLSLKVVRDFLTIVL